MVNLTFREYLKICFTKIKTFIEESLSTKQDKITGAASTVTNENLSSNRALVSNNDGKISVLETTDVEISFLRGTTGPVQTQLDTKLAQNMLFIGTKQEYETAWTNNEIAVGALVIITDDTDEEIITPPVSGATTAKLGSAVLGQMVLGQE